MNWKFTLLFLVALVGAACADKYYEITDSQGTGGWLVNGTTDPSLVFMVGETVTFHYTHVDTGIPHGLRLKTAQVTGNTSSLIAGVINPYTSDPSSPVDVIWQNVALGDYFYICYIHASMVGTMQVTADGNPAAPVSPPPTPVAAPTPVAPSGSPPPPSSASTFTLSMALIVASIAALAFVF